MEPPAHRLAAIVAACDCALERLAGVAHPEVGLLREAVERFREDARRRLGATAE